jgi:uncharacterized membrane protein YedE/YeeE
MPDTAHIAQIVVVSAFALAFVFGAVAQKVSFCTMGAVSDVVNFGDWRRMRMWLLAIAVAIAGAAALQLWGLVDFSKTIYTGARVPWMSHLVGGFLFGVGMTLASGCGSKTLIRAGAGNLKSLVVLVFLGIAAYMTLKGAFAPFRASVLDPVRIDFSAIGAPTSDLPALATAIGVPLARAWLPFVVAVAIALFAFASRDFRTARELVLGGVVIGAIIVAGWYLSGHIGYVAEDPATLEEKFVATNSGRAESYSFVAPVAYLLELLWLWTDQSRVVTFGIAGVLGMMIGSGAMALAQRSFRWEGFGSVEDVANHIVGAVMMGFGGVTALGCTIGQGLTGFSTLAIGSVLTFGAIVAGCVAAIRYQTWRLERESGVNSRGAAPLTHS